MGKGLISPSSVPSSWDPLHMYYLPWLRGRLAGCMDLLTTFLRFVRVKFHIVKSFFVAYDQAEVGP